MKIVSITDNGIVFDNGSKLTHYHSQDCCENVYADWESLKTESGVMDHDFASLPLIEFVNGSGIRIEGFFVPCYNKQNGYYSSELELIFKSGEDLNIKRMKHEITWNISDCVENHID